MRVVSIARAAFLFLLAGFAPTLALAQTIVDADFS
jgi:hypothetical protein